MQEEGRNDHDLQTSAGTLSFDRPDKLTSDQDKYELQISISRIFLSASRISASFPRSCGRRVSRSIRELLMCQLWESQMIHNTPAETHFRTILRNEGIQETISATSDQNVRRLLDTSSVVSAAHQR